MARLDEQIRSNSAVNEILVAAVQEQRGELERLKGRAGVVVEGVWEGYRLVLLGGGKGGGRAKEGDEKDGWTKFIGNG